MFSWSDDLPLQEILAAAERQIRHRAGHDLPTWGEPHENHHGEDQPTRTQRNGNYPGEGQPNGTQRTENRPGDDQRGPAGLEPSDDEPFGDDEPEPSAVSTCCARRCSSA